MCKHASSLGSTYREALLRIEPAFQVHGGQAGFVGFFPDGRTLFSTALERDGYDLDCVLKVWGLDGLVTLHRREYDHDVHPALSNDGVYLAWNHLSTGLIRIIRCDQSEPDREILVGDEPRLNDLLFVPGGHNLMFVYDRHWWQWDVTRPRPGHKFDLPVNRLLAISADGRRLALCPADTDSLTFEYWDLAKHQRVASIVPPDGAARKASWHPSRPLLATTGYWSEGVAVWDFTDPSCPRQTLLDSGSYTHQAFTPDGRLLTGHESGELAMWDVDTGRRVATVSTADLGQLKLVEGPDQITITQDKPGIASVAVSPDGRTVVAMTYGGAVALFEVD